MNIKRIISWSAVALWMLIIFSLSSQVAEQSNQLSTGVTDIIIKIIEKVFPNINFDIGSFNHIVRKNAHFVAYLVLGILVLNALRIGGTYDYRSVVLALVICVLYAITDEVHQLLVPGRSGQIKDVIIDSAGASMGIGLYLLINKTAPARNI